MNQLKLFQIDNLQTRPPLRYPGSKYGALKIIQKYLPKNNISDYCEPFFGSGAFFFKLIKSDAKIILNDCHAKIKRFLKRKHQRPVEHIPTQKYYCKKKYS